MTAFALARALRAGDTVFSSWCTLASPVAAETIAREGFAAVVLDQQHGLWDTAANWRASAAVLIIGAMIASAPKSSARDTNAKSPIGTRTSGVLPA